MKAFRLLALSLCVLSLAACNAGSDGKTSSNGTGSTSSTGTATGTGDVDGTGSGTATGTGTGTDDPQAAAGTAKGTLLLTDFCKGDLPYADRSQLVEGLGAYATAMTKAMAKSTENLVVSPLSVAYAFALLLQGAEGETQTEILQAFKLGTSSSDVEGLKDLAIQLRCPDPNAESKALDGLVLNISNAVWPAKAHPLDPAFLKAAHETFAAEAHELDFTAPAAAAATINAWSKEATYGKIPEILSVDDLTGADIAFVITNAIHFQDKWSAEFDVAKTKPADFFTKGGATAEQVPTMHHTKLAALYKETDAYQAVRLSYEDDAYFVIVLPKVRDGLDAVIAALDGNAIGIDYEGWDTALVNLSLPKFKIESSQNLNETLKALGLKRVFTAQAELLPMMANKNEPSPFVSKVLQRAVIDVHEQGTEAAAVTAVIGEAGSAPGEPVVPPTVDMVVDHPFVFSVIADQIVVFSGVVVDP